MATKKVTAKKPRTKKQLTGLGDVVKVVTEAVGIEQCEGCKKRQTLLNRLFPFSSVTPPNEEELSFLAGVFEWYKGLPISADKAEDIAKCEALWMKLFNVKTEPCRTCGAAYQNNFMKALQQLFENYRND